MGFKEIILHVQEARREVVMRFIYFFILKQKLFIFTLLHSLHSLKHFKYYN